jgi:hypothetical protein
MTTAWFPKRGVSYRSESLYLQAASLIYGASHTTSIKANPPATRRTSLKGRLYEGDNS